MHVRYGDEFVLRLNGLFGSTFDKEFGNDNVFINC